MFQAYILILNGFRTEIWSLHDNDNTVNMKIAEPTLTNYRYYPELFIVASDFLHQKLRTLIFNKIVKGDTEKL